MHYWECEEVVTRIKSFACCSQILEIIFVQDNLSEVYEIVGVFGN